MEKEGLDPSASRMQSERSTTELYPHSIYSYINKYLFKRNHFAYQ